MREKILHMGDEEREGKEVRNKAREWSKGGGKGIKEQMIHVKER